VNQTVSDCISCLLAGIFICFFVLLPAGNGSGENHPVRPSACFDRYCTFRFLKDFPGALSPASDYIVQKVDFIFTFLLLNIFM
jgi:hypothetical protein